MEDSIDRFMNTYKAPFLQYVVPLFEKNASTAYAECFSHLAESSTLSRPYMKAFVGNFWKPRDNAFMGTVAALMDMLVAQNSVERFRLILEWWKVYTHYHYQTALTEQFDSALRYVVLFHAEWCPLSALLDTKNDVDRFASRLFHQLLHGIRLVRDLIQVEMVLAFVGSSAFCPRINACLGRMPWKDYFLQENNMDYLIKVYHFKAKEIVGNVPKALSEATVQVESLFEMAGDVPCAVVNGNAFRSIDDFFGVVVASSLPLLESSPLPEVWNFCFAVHTAIDACQGAREYPPVVALENRLYRAAMAREGANFKSKKARAFRDVAGKNRIAALKKFAEQEQIKIK